MSAFVAASDKLPGRRKIASGIPFTFVRPTGFMSNLLAWAGSIRSEAVVRASTADGKRPFIHSEDIAGGVRKGLNRPRLVKRAAGVQRVLGRKPIGLDRWLTENAAAFC